MSRKIILEWNISSFLWPELILRIELTCACLADFTSNLHATNVYYRLYDNALLRLPFTWNVQPTRTPVVGECTNNILNTLVRY